MTNPSPPQVFNRPLARQRRERSGKLFPAHDFLHQRAMEDIIDRLESIRRDFPCAVFSGAGELTAKLTPACGAGAIFSFDSAIARLPVAPACGALAEEEAPPLGRETIDLYVSLLTLHGANDLVGALAQIRRALRPDGLFIAAVFGEETLTALKRALYQAESEITGGVSPRIAPFASVQSFGQALTRAGFALPVVDVDKISVRYEKPLTLFRDLRGMGETAALMSGGPALRRDVIARAAEIFTEQGGEERFDIVYLTGWAPHESQQKPLPPGSGRTSLAQAVKDQTTR